MYGDGSYAAQNEMPPDEDIPPEADGIGSDASPDDSASGAQSERSPEKTGGEKEKTDDSAFRPDYTGKKNQSPVSDDPYAAGKSLDDMLQNDGKSDRK